MPRTKKKILGAFDASNEGKILTLVTIGVVIGGAIYIISKLTPDANKDNKDSAAHVDEIETQFTKQKAAYDTLSDQIFQALNAVTTFDDDHWFGSGIDTTVIAPLKALNAEEIKQVVKAFGNKRFSVWIRPADAFTDYNLRAFAQKALDATEFQKLNNILTSAGI